MIVLRESSKKSQLMQPAGASTRQITRRSPESMDLLNVIFLLLSLWSAAIRHGYSST